MDTLALPDILGVLSIVLTIFAYPMQKGWEFIGKNARIVLKLVLPAFHLSLLLYAFLSLPLSKWFVFLVVFNVAALFIYVALATHIVQKNYIDFNTRRTMNLVTFQSIASQIERLKSINTTTLSLAQLDDHNRTLEKLHKQMKDLTKKIEEYEE